MYFISTSTGLKACMRTITSTAAGTTAESQTNERGEQPETSTGNTRWKDPACIYEGELFKAWEVPIQRLGIMRYGFQLSRSLVGPKSLSIKVKLAESPHSGEYGSYPEQHQVLESAICHVKIICVELRASPR